jgi:agmatinase
MDEDPDDLGDLTGHPPYAGRQTFLKSEQCAIGRISDAVKVGVVGVPFDGLVSGDGGAKYGPRAIRQASGEFSFGEAVSVERNRTVNLNRIRLRDLGDVQVSPTKPEETHDIIRETISEVAETCLPVVLGGDHSITAPSFRGFTKTMNEPVGFLQLDAHSDSIKQSRRYGKRFHGSTAARVNATEYGSYDTAALVGVRGYEPISFSEVCECYDLNVHTASDVHDRGIEACITDALNHLTNAVDIIYVTLDIDCVSPAFAPGTGTSEPGGLTDTQLLAAMRTLGECDEIGALDVVEVAPNLDPSGRTANLVSNALVQFLDVRFC